MASLREPCEGPQYFIENAVIRIYHFGLAGHQIRMEIFICIWNSDIKLHRFPALLHRRRALILKGQHK